MVKGVDLSYWNRGVDFNELVKQGIKFVILRIGYRGSKVGTIVKDECFEKFYKSAKEKGLDVGAYFFTQATTSQEALEEAEWCIKELADKKLEYPLYIDQENSTGFPFGRADYNTKREFTNVCKTFCQHCENKGFYAGIYASESWFKSKLYYEELKQFDKWIAKWSIFKPTTKYGTYGMWQNTNSMNIGGLRIDGNQSFYNYPEIMKNKGLNNYDKKAKHYDIIITDITEGDKDTIFTKCEELKIDHLTTIIEHE